LGTYKSRYLIAYCRSTENDIVDNLIYNILVYIYIHIHYIVEHQICILLQCERPSVVDLLLLLLLTPLALKNTLKSFQEIVFLFCSAFVGERYAVSPRWRHARYYIIIITCWYIVYKYIIMETRAYTILSCTYIISKKQAEIKYELNSFERFYDTTLHIILYYYNAYYNTPNRKCT